MDMHKQDPCCLLHRLGHHTEFGCHGRVCEFQRIEVQDGIQDLIGNGWASTDEDGKGV